MTKKQQRIIELIEKMEQNTFLLPDGWMSEPVIIATKDMTYRTYVGRRGTDRYISFEINDKEKFVKLNFRNNDVEFERSVFDKNITINQVIGYVEDIYKEQHSFIENAEGIKKIRAEIKQNRQSIKRLQEENKKLEQQIIDALKLKGQ